MPAFGTRPKLNEGQSQFGFAPKFRRQLFSHAEHIIDLNAEITDHALDLHMSPQQLHGTQVSGATVNECRFSASKRVRAENVRVEADRCSPTQAEPSILQGRHRAAMTTRATEQKFARFLGRGFGVMVDGLPRLLR